MKVEISAASVRGIEVRQTRHGREMQMVVEMNHDQMREAFGELLRHTPGDKVDNWMAEFLPEYKAALDRVESEETQS
jgi:hypothetical protein